MGRINKKRIILKRLDINKERIRKSVITSRRDKSIKPMVTPNKSQQNQKNGSISRMEARTGIQQNSIPKCGYLLYNKHEKRNKNYVKRNDAEYDVVIITGSFNRYEMVRNQIKQFFEQETKYKFKYILLNDASNDIRYDSIKEDFPEIVYLKNEKPNGKFGYWKTITQLLKESKNYLAHTILQIDDDFYLCKNYLDKILNIFFEQKTINNYCMGISYHLYGPQHITETRWDCPNGSWADGGGLYDYDFFANSGFKINEIPKWRWDGYNKILSSGVWEQVSKSVNTMGGFIYKTQVSYVKHEGIVWGSLERKDKSKNNKAITYKFVDNE